MSAEMQTKVQANPAQSFIPVQTGLLQRKSALCNTPGLVEESGRDKEKLNLQRSSVDGTTTVPPIVHKALRSPGQPLDPVTRAFMEPLFGHDFSKVRVHSTGRGKIQTKLKINKPGDLYEQEADRVAKQVMRMPAVQRQTEEELVQTKPVITPLVQRPSEGDEEEEIFHTKELPGQSPKVNLALSSSIQSLKGGGQPLSENDRTFFEPRFGYDFSSVRVHTGTQADKAAWEVNARAFTVGPHVVFGEGQYAPRTNTGQRLMAHELTHVVQQVKLSGSKFESELMGTFLQRKPISKKKNRLESKKVLRVEILKTKGMNLSTVEGKSAFLAIVIRHILPYVDQITALTVGKEMVDEIEIDPVGIKTLEKIIKIFESATLGEKFTFGVDRSFLVLLNKYLAVPISLLEIFEEYRPLEVPTKEQPEKETDCWNPILTKFTAEERYTWAYARIAESLKSSLGRYEPGKAYGNLMFVYHPYTGFPDEQVWMTIDNHLYRINERHCMIEAFRKGVVSAAPMVVLAWIVTGVTAGVAAGLVAGPLLVKAGYGLYTWGLANPITATNIGHIGAEVTLSIATGDDMPPISPSDEIAFAVYTGTKKAVKAGRKILLEVVDGAETGSRRTVKGIVKKVEALPETSLDAWNQGKSVVHIVSPSAKAVVKEATKEKSPFVAKGMGRFLPETINWLAKKGLIDKAKESLPYVKPDIVLAVNKFHDVKNFDLVLKAYFEGGNKQEGARFVMRYAVAHFADKVGKIIFEMPSMRKAGGGTGRFVDLFADGIRYEFKSVKEISSTLVKGRAATFGQLQKDIIFAIGGDLSRLKSLKWVFDGKKMLAAGLKEEDVVERLGDLLSETELFKGYILCSKI